MSVCEESLLLCVLGTHSQTYHNPKRHTPQDPQHTCKTHGSYMLVVGLESHELHLKHATVLTEVSQYTGKPTPHPWDIEASLGAGGQCWVTPSGRSHLSPLPHSSRQWQNREHHVESFLQYRDKMSKAQFKFLSSLFSMPTCWILPIPLHNIYVL